MTATDTPEATNTRPMPTIGEWRAPEKIRTDWQILCTALYQEDGTERWHTVVHALRIEAPVPLTHLRFDDGSSLGMPGGDGYEMFTRTPAEAERAAKKQGA